MALAPPPCTPHAACFSWPDFLPLRHCFRPKRKSDTEVQGERQVTYVIKCAAHVLIVMSAFIVSYSLRRGLTIDWWLTNELAHVIVGWTLVSGVVAGAYEVFLFKNERSAWSYTSIGDVFKLVQATALTSLTLLAFAFMTERGITLPRSTLLLSWVLSLFGLVGIRIAFRLSVERSGPLFGFGRKVERDARPLVLVGDPRLAAAYLKRHAADDASNYTPVGIVVRDPALIRQVIHNVPVVGRYGELETALRSRAMPHDGAASLLFLEDPLAELGLEPDLIGRLRATGHTLLRLPRPSDLSAKAALREISLEELLPREPIALDPGRLHGLVSGKRVLVTGAGGSIGSEICRQLAALECAHITLVDQSEFLLFEIDRELSATAPNAAKDALLCDVRDSDRLATAFRTSRPDIVFHAAALKHVRLVELNPCEAVLTNVLGTWNVAQLSKETGVSQLVLISTDKAVDPTSFMGATKRLAESLLPVSTESFRCCVVRFGNVLGSAGSVVPIFLKQIAQGGPVTVTHPEVTRFFMTIPEAVQLVLHAAAISSGDSISKTRKFVLEMGKPVSILSLAKQLIELSGLQPGRDIQITFSGLKPGEKLNEELLDKNEETRLVDVGLSEIRDLSNSLPITRREINRLTKVARSGDEAGIRKAVRDLIEQVRGPSNEFGDPVEGAS